MKGNVCQESMQKFCKALKRSFTGPTSCRPPSAPHRTSPRITRGSCPLPFRILHVCTFHKFWHVFTCSKIKLNPVEGVMSAVLRQPSGVMPRTLYLMVLAFSVNKSKWTKNLEKHRVSKSLWKERCWSVSWELPGALFSDPEIRKTHFFEKGPRTGKNLKFHFLVYALLCYLLCSTLLLDGLFR